MTKEKPIHGLTIALRQPMTKAIGGNWAKALAMMVRLERGADVRELDPKEVPTAEIVQQAIEVVRQQAGLLIADLEAIKQQLTENPPARRPRGKPFGWRKEKHRNMELKQHKKCVNCRAFLDGKCDLSFPIKPILVLGSYVNGIPLEPCPKPTTVTNLVECLQNEKTNRNIQTA